LAGGVWLFDLAHRLCRALANSSGARQKPDRSETSLAAGRIWPNWHFDGEPAAVTGVLLATLGYELTLAIIGVATAVALCWAGARAVKPPVTISLLATEST
jgi:hypothetical protein